ncbi:MAG: glycosyltransferase family 2 protein [Patescibacteria group bacterium]|jgi:dolichyl-phosphate beta-glucosyltransferase|nr:glycosyltransferase family 2 protein [Patescibacteria group bacterium]
MAKPFLSVIIPAYNEAERIPKTLLDMDKYLSQAGFSYEIIVVNDGSKDKTAEVVEKMRPLIKNLKLIDNKFNQGKGGVVAQGMLEAKGLIRLFADADNSTPIEQIEKFFPYFKEGYDVVIGSRAMKDSQLAVKQPFYRQILGRLGNLVIRLLAVPAIKDTQCGFKAFTEQAAEKIFSQLTIKRWGFDVEVLVIARLLGYRIKEVGIRWINDPHSKVKASAFLEVLTEVLKIRLNIWRKKYKLN